VVVGNTSWPTLQGVSLPLSVRLMDGETHFASPTLRNLDQIAAVGLVEANLERGMEMFTFANFTEMGDGGFQCSARIVVWIAQVQLLEQGG